MEIKIEITYYKDANRLREDTLQREYFLEDEAAEAIFNGESLNFTTCHPEYGEVCRVSLLP